MTQTPTTPTIDLIPLRAAICSDKPTTLDLVIRITPPEVEPSDPSDKRPSLNLGFVIDRSGSMASRGKIDYARQAVCYAIEQLLPSDRLSITIFDDKVHTLVANAPVADKASLIRLVQQISPGGTTALHPGWVEGGIQVSQHLNADLNRVILLSDGLANVGETNPDLIASDVHGLAQRGVSTSAIGLGDDYNEDLLEAMARSGDGNYAYISSPEQLPALFAQELQGLTATIGNQVTLALTPLGDVAIADILNDLNQDNQQRYVLPNLLRGFPINVALRLKIPALAQPTDLLTLHLTWNDPEQNIQRQLSATLNLPVVKASQLDDFPVNQEVQQQVTLMMSARAKQEAVQLADRRQYDQARNVLQNARMEMLNSNVAMAAPEAAAMEDLLSDLDEKNYAIYRKKARSQSYRRSSHRSSGHTDLVYAFGKGPVYRDITEMRVEAIVNSTDSHLSDHGPLSRAIHRVAGPELAAACRQFNGCSPGEARLTPGFNLPAQWVIHTVCPSWQGGHRGELDTLKRCYESILAIAIQEGFRSLAIPALGTGALGFPPEQAAKVAFKTLSQTLLRTTAIGTVYVVTLDETVLEAFRQEFNRIAAL
jgi:Ca-activated chloride channel family protein